MSAHRCPECGEPAINRPPAASPWAESRGDDLPDWSHADGEPLCPVIGDGGYEPARPDRRTR